MNSKLTWKPVLLPTGLCVKDDNIWFMQSGGNQLIRADIHSFEILDKFYIPWEKGFFHRGCGDQILDVGDKLLILLNESNCIYAFDVIAGNLRKVTALPHERVFRDNIVVCRNGNLYILPYDNNDVLKYDYINDFWEQILIGNSGIRMERCFEEEGDVITSVDGGTNKIIRLFLSEKYIEEIAVGKDSCRYWGIKKAADFFVLPHKNEKAVTLWNEKTGELYELTDFPYRYDGIEEWAYLNMYKNQDDIFIFPYYANMILRVDVNNKKIDQAFPAVLFEKDYADGLICFPKETYIDATECQKKVYLYAEIGQYWQVFDMERMTVHNYPKYEIVPAENKKCLGTLFDGESGKFFMTRESRVTNCNFDNYILSLDDAVNEGRSDQENDGLNQVTENRIGEKIWMALH